MACNRPLSLGLHAQEVCATADASLSTEAEGQAASYFLKIETVRRARPLRRRFARTLDPPRVDMRARKPWVRKRRWL